jgi:hypothetical protein
MHERDFFWTAKLFLEMREADTNVVRCLVQAFFPTYSLSPSNHTAHGTKRKLPDVRKLPFFQVEISRAALFYRHPA